MEGTTMHLSTRGRLYRASGTAIEGKEGDKEWMEREDGSGRKREGTRRKGRGREKTLSRV